MNKFGIKTLLATLILATSFGMPQAVADAQTTKLPDETETPRMKAWCDLHYGLFLHFGLATFAKEKNQSPKLYVTDKLDVDGWVRVARDGGMKYAVLTAKHNSGFCVWDSKALWHGKEFDYDVAASGNPTDVVKAFMDACKKYGIVPGLYYNLRDSHADAGAFNEKSGKKPLNKEYFNLVKAQLTELTTRYPDCHYYWIDHPASANAGQLADIYELLRCANPGNVVLFNTHLATKLNKSTTSVFEQTEGHGFPADVIDSEGTPPHLQGPVPKYQSWQGRHYFVGYEHCATIGGGWFNTHVAPKPTEKLFELYQTVRNYGGNLLLDIGPDRHGQIDGQYAKALIELKAKIEPFEASLAESKH